MKALIEIKEIAGDWRVDSETVGRECQVQHKNVLELLDAHRELAESHFGTFAFETRKSAGRQSRVALLTEDQATFLITLMRNTEPVLRFKAALVKAFREARDLSLMADGEESAIDAAVTALEGNAAAAERAREGVLDGTLTLEAARVVTSLCEEVRCSWQLRLKVRPEPATALEPWQPGAEMGALLAEAAGKLEKDTALRLNDIVQHEGPRDAIRAGRQLQMWRNRDLIDGRGRKFRVLHRKMKDGARYVIKFATEVGQ